MEMIVWMWQKSGRYLMLLMILLVFAPTSNAQSPETTTEQIILWHAYTGAQQGELEALIDQFNTAHDGEILLTAVSMENTGRLYDQVIINLLADDYQTRLPNLILTNPDTAAIFALSNNLIELTPYINQLDDIPFLPNVLALGQNTQDAQYLLPTHLHTEVLVINESALAEMNANPPTTPSEFGTLACQFRQNSGWSQGKFGAVWGAYLPMHGNFLSAYLTAQNSVVYQANTSTFQFDTPETAELLRPLVSFHQNACTTVTHSSAIALDDFAAGKSLFYFAHTSELSNIEIGIASNFVEPFEWGVYPLLADKNAPLWIDGQGLSIIDHDEAQDLASWRFMEWLISEHVHFSTWLQLTNGFPIRQDVGDDLAESDEMTSQWTQTWTLFKSEHVHKPMLASGEVVYFKIESAWRHIYINFSDPNLELETLDMTLNDILSNFGDR